MMLLFGMSGSWAETRRRRNSDTALEALVCGSGPMDRGGGGGGSVGGDGGDSIGGSTICILRLIRRLSFSTICSSAPHCGHMATPFSISK